MAGSDLPASGGASHPPPRTPTPTPRSAKKRKRDDDYDSAGPSRATRGSAAARKAVAGAVRMARRAAAGGMWAARTGRGSGRGRGLGDVEGMREVILAVRLKRSVRVPDGDADDFPYPAESRRSGSRSTERVNCKISYLSSYPLKRPEIDPVRLQASVPEWKEPSDKEAADYKAINLPKLGTLVCPPNMDISATDESEKTRKEVVDNCICSHPGSEDCVQDHVKKARSWIKDQLGEEAFKNCGLDAMGEQDGESWTAADKKKLEDLDKLIPQNKHQTFMKIALKKLRQKKKKDLAKYYYNVFLPRRLASLTRAEHKKDEAVDTDDEKSSQNDDNNEHRYLKSRSSGSSSTRCRKWKYSRSGPTVTSKQKKN